MFIICLFVFFLDTLNKRKTQTRFWGSETSMNAYVGKSGNVMFLNVILIPIDERSSQLFCDYWALLVVGIVFLPTFCIEHKQTHFSQIVTRFLGVVPVIWMNFPVCSLDSNTQQHERQIFCAFDTSFIGLVWLCVYVRIFMCCCGYSFV